MNFQQTITTLSTLGIRLSLTDAIKIAEALSSEDPATENLSIVNYAALRASTLGVNVPIETHRQVALLNPDVMQALSENRKITAIKHYRTVSHLGLVECKIVMDYLWDVRAGSPVSDRTLAETVARRY